jgi:hypothetical protein
MADAAAAMQSDAPATCQCRPARELAGPARSLPSLALVLLLGLFPKCAMCWTAYLSVFGSAWLTRIPYAGWIYPLLLVTAAAYLWSVLRNATRQGYAPFLFGIAGIGGILLGRSLIFDSRWPLVIGLILMFTGSLLNSFRVAQRHSSSMHPTEKRGSSCLPLQG